MKLEDLQPNAAVRGIVPDALATVVGVHWFGSDALEVTYKTPAGKVANELLYRDDEPRLEVVEHGRPWSFDGDGGLFRLVSEAQRIRLALRLSAGRPHLRGRAAATSNCLRSTNRCCRVSCASYSLTSRALERLSWRVC